ncbi:hypothetical protein SEA_DARTHPHADER_43 [Mycobacterium phage DarthPhader]|uniref:Uncharacterized protein n=1 Tax=Mycobacterium phage DarthPhader TaxID=1912975 RepID=A0A1I9S3Y9_9CAUD|nr:hypothetical protein KIV60_gp58 [Mycobacterium phage DarthPhader]AOZ61283.1 hypothetical protein SEA_DARTHPHADER_43 [Mycobacterium phage DarthPhader]
MPDRAQVIIIVPRDGALPIDVQGVNLRRMAIDLMSELGEVDENSVRYKAGTEDATVAFGGGEAYVSLWQHNAMAAMWQANLKVSKEITGPIIHQDEVTRVRSAASFVRDIY